MSFWAGTCLPGNKSDRLETPVRTSMTDFHVVDPTLHFTVQYPVAFNNLNVAQLCRGETVYIVWYTRHTLQANLSFCISITALHSFKTL